MADGEHSTGKLCQMEEAGNDGDRGITPEQMKQRTKRLALRVLHLTRSLPNTLEAQAIRRQLVRCATSVGANYRAAQRARSHKEFQSKLGNVEEEADETCFWLELIIEDEMLAAQRVNDLHNEAWQIVAIVSRARQTAGKNHLKPLQSRARLI